MYRLYLTVLLLLGNKTATGQLTSGHCGLSESCYTTWCLYKVNMISPMLHNSSGQVVHKTMPCSVLILPATVQHGTDKEC